MVGLLMQENGLLATEKNSFDDGVQGIPVCFHCILVGLAELFWNTALLFVADLDELS